MIDLTLQKKEYYKIKWFDGVVLSLKPPTQKLYKEVSRMTKVKDEMEVLATVYDTISEIINNNTDNRVIENIQDLDVDTCLMILGDYFAFWQKQLDSVVFQQSQQMTD